MKDQQENYLSNWGQVLLLLSFDYTLPLWKYIGLDFPKNLQLDTQEIMRYGYMERYKNKTRISRYDYKTDVKILITELLNKLDDTVAEKIKFMNQNLILIYDREASDNAEFWREMFMHLYRYTLSSRFLPSNNIIQWDAQRYILLTQFIDERLVIPDEQWHGLIRKFNYDLEYHSNDILDTAINKIIYTDDESDGLVGIFVDFYTLFSTLKGIGDNYRLLQFWIEFTEAFEKEEVESVTKWIKKGFDGKKIEPPPFLQHLVS